jgi:hypothetical protein
MDIWQVRAASSRIPGSRLAIGTDRVDVDQVGADHFTTAGAIGRVELLPRSRLVSSGDWFIFVVWVIAGVASVLVALQPGATQGTVMLVVAGVAIVLAAGGWVVDRLGVYSLPPSTRPTRKSLVATAVLFQPIWWIGYAIVGGIGPNWSALASAANFIWFVAGLQLTDLFARSVDRYRQSVVGRRGSPQQA